MNEIVTIDDIARCAGVGKGTVDRVLHSRGRVSEETRQRVLRCIEELNYRPNKAARMLARKRNYRIGVCYHTLESAFWDQIREGIDNAAMEYAQMGVELEFMLLDRIDAEAQVEVINRVAEEGMDGLVLVPYRSEEIVKAVNRLLEKGIEVVAFNNHEANLNVCYVGDDNLQSGRTAGRMMSLLAPQGSRCGILSLEDRWMKHLENRVIGFQEVLDARRGDMTVECYRLHDESYDRTIDFVMEHCDEMDAIYVPAETVSAVGRALRNVPGGREKTVVGHDLTPEIISAIRDGFIDASIGQDPRRQGYASVDKICRKLLTGETITDEYTRISIVMAENLDFA